MCKLIHLKTRKTVVSKIILPRYFVFVNYFTAISCKKSWFWYNNRAKELRTMDIELYKKIKKEKKLTGVEDNAVFSRVSLFLPFFYRLFCRYLCVCKNMLSKFCG